MDSLAWGYCFRSGNRKDRRTNIGRYADCPDFHANSTADPGEHGYIIHFGGHRRTVEIKATAKFVSIENCSGTEASATVQVGTRSIAANKPADVTRLKLSAQNLVASCEPGREPRADRPASKDMVVDAEVYVLDAENDVLTFSYKVSGGRIIGTGQK
jgi:hypothetical protein